MNAAEPAMLSRWFDQYGRSLVLYAAQWLGREAAEDAVQEVFLRLCSTAGPILDVKHWLFRSVRNAAIDRLRRHRRQTRYERARASEPPALFLARADDLLDARAVQDALVHLPTEQREIIVLRIWCDMTLAEASKLTGEPVSTLFSRYRTGLNALRRRMEKPCDTTIKTT